MSSGGDDSDFQWQPYNIDEQSIRQFAQTSQGKGYSGTINNISDYNVAKQNGTGRIHAKVDGVDTDITQMDQAYTAWLATQKDFNQQRQSYLDLASQEKGRDSTILTGPAATPQGTVLAPFNPAKPRF